MATYKMPLLRPLNKDFFTRNSSLIIGLLFVLSLLLLFVYTVYNGLRSGENVNVVSESHYTHCPNLSDTKINVHILAHSHDDVAWLKTFDQYYYGTESKISRAGVQFILETVITELLANPNRRFVQVETAFFWKWWQEQSPNRQELISTLVREGRLEFAGGAWSMNDEATTDYVSIIDNFTWGFRKLSEMFGDILLAKPKVGWQIDPFGHSREQASLFAQFGFDGAFINRIDYQDKAQRMKTKRAEFIWKSSPNLGRSTDLFTVALYNHYSSIDAFDYSPNNEHEAVVDDKKSAEYNVNKLADQMLNAVNTRSKLYNTNNVFLTWGDDFTFQNAAEWFINMDKIIRYINENSPDYNVFYSTPSCFVNAVNKNETLQLTTKEGDFFPYVSSGHSYWTGFYTSRPTLKYFINQAANFLQIVKQLLVLADTGENPSAKSSLDEFRSTLGLMQHHDAITGTSRDLVVKNYKLEISKALEQAGVSVDSAIKKLLANSYSEDNEELRSIDFSSCLRTNMTECPISESGKPFIVTLYNPLSRPVTHFVRLPVMGDGLVAYTVTNPQGEKETVQLVPIPQPVFNIPERRSNSTMEIVFKADNIPPFGIRSYHVEPTNDQIYGTRLMPLADVYTIGDIKGTAVALNGTTGTIKSCFIDGIVYPLHQTFKYYVNRLILSFDKPSGAYVFNPVSNEPQPVSTDKPEIKVYAGELVDEIHQIYNKWLSQVIRVYKGEDHIEFEWLVGPLDVRAENYGKEVVAQYSIPKINSSGIFYTDSNGREMNRRIRNARDSWTVEMGNNSASGNYYPVTSRITIQDSNTQMSVMPDRSEGGTSIKDGEIEIMLHRDTLLDDELGVGEALVEIVNHSEVVVRGKHYLTIGPNQRQNAKDRLLIDRKKNQVWTFVTQLDNIEFFRWNELFKMEFNGLQLGLPNNVRIITLEPWSDGKVLLRLEHFFEKTDDIELSKSTIVNLEGLFAPFTISSVKEMTLGANNELKNLNRLKWKTQEEENANDSPNSSTLKYDSWKRLIFTPMQIRTFIITVTYS